MKTTLFLLVLASLLATGCTTPLYDDGSRREHSEMPWNTPASWEGSIYVPGMDRY